MARIMAGRVQQLFRAFREGGLDSMELTPERVFYSGNFRARDREARLFEEMISDPPENIDVLLIEGSTIGRAGKDNGYPSEAQLETRFFEIFERTKDQSLVWASGQNIDRLVTL